jgi:uncharacterized membrane protein
MDSDSLELQLRRWNEAGLISSEAAERIREFESSHHPATTRWPVLLAIAFGAIMVAAGVLLFVAAHWENLSPGQRFVLVLAMVAGFHLAAGALTSRLHALGLALHGVGTVALGAAIFLTGQIFNLQEHWPTGILLWAVGAVLAWLVLRDWVQATLSALLIPAWIASEWGLRADRFREAGLLMVQFFFLLAIAYLGARGGKRDSTFRRALVWIGAIAILPAGGALASASHDLWGEWTVYRMPLSLHATGLCIAFFLPLVVAWALRQRGAVWNCGFAAWAFVVGGLNLHDVLQNLVAFGLFAAASIALVMWGLEEHRRERVNLGVAAFAITVTVFYFSSVMDKMGRSASLVAFGLLFLLGGWKLEQLRRRLVARAMGARA